MIGSDFRVIRTVWLVLLWAAVLQPVESAAVSLNESGYGQALLFPFFSAAQGNASLITIANDLAPSATTPAAPSAVKMRLLGAIDGAELANFNLYLGERDAWVAAIHASNGETVISTSDGSCIFPAPQNGILVTLSEAIGSIEVIQMASVTEEVLVDEIDENACAAIDARWTLGPWDDTPSVDLVPPVGNLRGSLVLIHVEKGTAYSYPAVALDDFSDIVQHSDTNVATPNLSTAHDEGTDSLFGTTSTVCIEGDCVNDFWAFPIDAVAAVLTARELHGEFVVADSLAARTEWIIAYPTHRYSNAPPPSEHMVSLLLQDREGDGAMVQSCSPDDPASYACNSSYRLTHADAIEVVSFGRAEDEFGTDAVSAILGKPFEVDFPRPDNADVPSAGTARLGFEGELVNEMGTVYLGTPVIAIGLQEYTNAFLESPDGISQRANYGTALPLSRVPRLTIPAIPSIR